LPRFEAITPDQVDQHMPELMAQLEAELGTVESHLEQAEAAGRTLSWAEVMDPLHRLGERLRWS
jgi:oligopeptidase A